MRQGFNILWRTSVASNKEKHSFWVTVGRRHAKYKMSGISECPWDPKRVSIKILELQSLCLANESGPTLTCLSFAKDLLVSCSSVLSGPLLLFFLVLSLPISKPSSPLSSPPNDHYWLKWDCAGPSYESHNTSMKEQSNPFLLVTRWKAKTIKFTFQLFTNLQASI